MSRALCLLIAALGELPAQQYFPPGVFDTPLRGHDSRASWYSRHLKALHEPSLWELSRDPRAEAYRFLWLRSFHHPIVVRLVVRSSGSGWIHVGITNDKGGNEPGRMMRRQVSWLTKTKTQSLLAAFESADFWNLPTLAVAEQGAARVDGAQWVLEGVRGGRYHVVDRFCPDAGDPARAIGALALMLGRVRIRPGEVY
ncbi:MAG: hypothetical protein ABSH56_31415 [Bryobacteraceae bacterium]